MKRVILEFIGGCWDGMNLCNDSPDPVEVRMAGMCLGRTLHGTLGKTVIVPSDYSTQRGSEVGNRYVVVHRTDFGGEVLVRLELSCEDQTADCPCHIKRIILNFEGGRFHGVRLDSNSPDLSEAILATSCFCLTDHGRPGSTLGQLLLLPHLCRDRNLPPCTGDEYQVVGREEGEDHIAVRLCYRPESLDESETP